MIKSECTTLYLLNKEEESFTMKEKTQDYFKIIIILSAIVVTMQVILKKIGFVQFDNSHIIFSIILFFAGIYFHQNDKYCKIELYYIAVVFMNDFIILCPVFFMIGRIAFRSIK